MNDDTKKRQIYILGETNIQNSLLGEFLQTNLGYKCRILNKLDGKPLLRASDCDNLLLIDYTYLSQEDFGPYLEQLTRESDCLIVAVFNVQMEYPHDQLIEWPIIRGIFYVSATQQQLLKGIRAIFDGEYWFARWLINRYLERHRTGCHRPSKSLALLTTKEQQILWHIAAGGSNKQIADRLNISDCTVKTHIYNIFRKLNVSNRVQALNWVQTHQTQQLNNHIAQGFPSLMGDQPKEMQGSTEVRGPR